MLVRFFYGLAALAVASVLCVLYGWLIEPRRLVVRDEVVPQALPNVLTQPLKIAFVSDIHAGGRGVDARRVGKVVAAINAGAPDLVLVAGDLINGHTPRPQRSAQALARLDTALRPLGLIDAPLGAFAVAGNHDNWFGNTDALYADLGLTRIDNVAHVIEGRACVFGLADEWTAQPSADVVTDCPDDLPTIGFMHNPDSAFRLRPGADLLLAGHTHGGQVNLPILGRVVNATRAGKHFAYGWSFVNAVPMFVTAGVGMSGLPVRFRAPPEVVFITLR